ncbi:MAG: OmpA family protein [Myxococcales bacterium]|nr:OmpA family protein [Myxococcales bacterium]
MLLGALLLGAPALVSCVSKGAYRDVVTERDDLAGQKSALEERVRALDEEKASLGSELSSRKQEVSNLQGTYDSLVADLHAELASGQIQIQQLRDGIRLDVADDILFPSGSARIDDGGKAVLDKVAAQVKNASGRVEVTGHTDNVPIRGGPTARYPTNWELGAARAASVVRILQDQGVEGTRLQALSAGEYRPRASNETEQGRQRNRRIEIRLRPVATGEAIAEEGDADESGVSPPASD